MTVNPLILDPNGFNQTENYNIANMDDQIPCITINVSQSDEICAWITSKGGAANVAVFDIMTLVSAYLEQANLGFVVTISHIMGAVAYYLDNAPSGDSLTGCAFAP